MAAAALAVVAAVVVLLVTRGPGAPPDAAAKLVPASALAYVHLGTDPDREPDRRLARELGAFPAVKGLRSRLAVALGRDFDLARDVRPWLGEEAAIALLDTGGSRADSLILLAVRDRPKADAFLDRVAGNRGATTYRGVEIERFTAVSIAFAGGFMAIGQDSAVRAAIDRAQGRGGSFAASVAYRRATKERPDERALDVVLPADGVERVLTPQAGALGVLGSLLTAPRLVSVGASVAAEDDGLRIAVRQARSGGPAPAEFEPKLVEEVPKAAGIYLGFSGVEALGAMVPAGAREALGKRLRDALAGADLDLGRDLVGPLRGEAALSVTEGLPVPTATLVVKTSDEQRTREAMARLQQPIAEQLAPPPSSGAAQAQFEQRELGDVPAFSLSIAPGVELTYAVASGRLIVSSQANGVGHVLAQRASLRDSAAFERSVGDLPDRAEAVLFLDLGQLLALAEQAGSQEDPAFQAIRDDLRRVREAGAVVQREGNDSTAELFLQIP